ncbi:MAG: hypothetical protein IJQ73_01130 [Kiritimatiellae bacterium]|nr:hypothetical protein [Kiritimatiellia bacterium]
MAAQAKEDAAELHVGPLIVDIHVNGLSRMGRHPVLAAVATHHKPDWAKVRIGRANAGLAAKVRQKPGDKHLDAPGIIGGHSRVPVDIGIGHARLGQGILVSIPQMLKYPYGVGKVHLSIAIRIAAKRRRSVFGDRKRARIGQRGRRQREGERRERGEDEFLHGLLLLFRCEAWLPFKAVGSIAFFRPDYQ